MVECAVDNSKAVGSNPAMTKINGTRIVRTCIKVQRLCYEPSKDIKYLAKRINVFQFISGQMAEWLRRMFLKHFRNRIVGSNPSLPK